MNMLSPGRKITSLVCLIAGAVSMVAALVMDFSNSENAARGPLLIITIEQLLMYCSCFHFCLLLLLQLSFLCS